jgi:hypothetical protein
MRKAGGLWLRHGAALVLFGHDELQEPQWFGGARVPVRVNCSRGSKQAVASMQDDGWLILLLPDTGAGQDTEADSDRMKMVGVGGTRSILGIPDGYLFPTRVRKLTFQQQRVGNARLRSRRRLLQPGC